MRLRNDAAETGVQLRLRGDDVRADLAVVADDRRGSLVARVSIPRITGRRSRAAGSLPHDERVLAVVGVVPAANAAEFEAESRS
jgi:hypothetical protein